MIGETQNTTYDKVKYILEEGWASRQEIARELGCSINHVTSLMSNMTHRHDINIERRKHPIKKKQIQYRVSFQTKEDDPKIQPRSEHASYLLLIQEMNHIRLTSQEMGNTEIRIMAEKAMLAAGVATEYAE
jgi:hypothetical protein